MTNLHKNLVTAIATGAVLLSTVTPVFADTTLTVAGNGSDSDNTVKLNQDNNVQVKQNNDATISNDINVKSDTGNNRASGNTGGDSTITTGAADSTVNVTNTANRNDAVVDPCNCTGDTTVKVAGNGSESNNTVKLNEDNNVRVNQDNNANIHNNIDSKANTGGNRANDNTGGGASITTGDASTTTTVSNTANYNSAVVGGGNGNGNGGGVSALISGNGSYSDNTVKLDLGNDARVSQDNNAHFYNDIDSDAITGNNRANDNTGDGDVSVDTGAANSDVTVDNMANFNYADLDGCGCMNDLSADVHGNGTASDNRITFGSDSDLRVGQDNDSRFNNDVNGTLKTGNNRTNDNTEFNGDPSVTTGDSSSDVNASNTGNVNMYGANADSSLLDNLNHVNFSFDLGDLMSWLSSHV